jgi:hypothetical protein
MVSDEAVRPVFHELFDAFNFTVTESTPWDIEVAVDPEMLGKVFEELVTERHKTGAFYTPRTIVSFMCREALKGYLYRSDIGLDPVEIEDLVEERKIPPSADVNHLRSIMSALQRVKVADPACGSGAFLLGMIQELIDLQITVARSTLVKDPVNMYQFKLNILQRNVYGADIDPFAVNIAMLRLWLSLVIEYDGLTPPPLPNLDFKIVCGDSLRGPDPSPTQTGDMFRLTAHNFADEIARLKDVHMRAQGSDKELAVKELIAIHERLAEQLGGAAAPTGTIDWRIDFAEVVAREGFDIILANPPYEVVKDKKIRSLYQEGIYGRMNLYGLFIQRSLQLLREGGQLVFINPKTLLTDRYFSALRQVLKRNSEIGGVVLIEDRHKTFVRVLQECIILLLTKAANPAPVYKLRTRTVAVPSDLDNREAYLAVDCRRVLLGTKFDEAFYIGTAELDYSIFETMIANGVTLGAYGLSAKTGNIQYDKYQSYSVQTNVAGGCRLMWAENVQRFTIRHSRARADKQWLRANITDAAAPNIYGSGILTQRITASEQPRRIIATLINQETIEATAIYSENHTNYVDGSESDSLTLQCLLASLNSSALEFVFRRLNSNTQVSAGEINALPFPDFRSRFSAKETLAGLVSELLALRGVDCDPSVKNKAIALELQIDEIVFDLFHLDSGAKNHIYSRLTPLETVYN